MADWNWFFSALSQCSAAIVGLFGAFIVAQIISRENELSLLRKEIGETKARIYERLLLLEKTRFSWYNNCLRKRILSSPKMGDYLVAIKSGQIEANLDKIIYELNFSIYDNRDNLREFLEQEIEKYKSTGKRSIAAIFLYDADIQRAIDDEEKNINKENIATEKLTDEVWYILDRIKAFSKGKRVIAFVLGLLAILFFSGVIYPLNFMPIKGELILCSINGIPTAFFFNLISFKGILLSIISVLFIVILTIFFFKNLSQNISSDDKSHLKKYRSLDNYSEYFKNMIENEKLAANQIRRFERP